MCACAEPVHPGILGRVRPSFPKPVANDRLPLHSPYVIPEMVIAAREKDPDAGIPVLTRELRPYGPPGPGGTEISAASGSRGATEEEYLVTYAPHSALWIDLSDTETRAQHPRLMAEEIVGSSYRVWTNMKSPEAAGSPSKRHPEEATPSNAPLTCRFTRWRTLRDAIHGHDLEGFEAMIESGAFQVDERGAVCLLTCCQQLTSCCVGWICAFARRSPIRRFIICASPAGCRCPYQHSKRGV